VGNDKEKRMIIREEIEEDRGGIRELHEQAFEQSLEADIVDALRKNCTEILSLVADHEGKIIGHVLFSPAEIEGPHGLLKGMALAPMAVQSDMRRKGVGTRLVKHGLVRFMRTQCPFIVVIGRPDYYRHFDFEPASTFGIKCQWENIPDEAFTILWTDRTKIQGVSGVARFREEFNEAV
jgi:putative acetyltransferase